MTRNIKQPRPKRRGIKCKGERRFPPSLTLTPSLRGVVGYASSASHAAGNVPGEITITHTPNVRKLAHIHAACFPVAWSASEMEGLLNIKETMACETEGGFALLRLVDGEAEILTIAVMPEMRRRGIGAALTQAMLDWLKHNNAKAVFLEVRQSNEAAITMYHNLGFLQISQRKHYYRNLDGSYESALVMQRVL